MKQASKWIRERRSVRTYDGRALSEEDIQRLLAFMDTIDNPYGMPVSFKLLRAKEHGLTCPVVRGTELYVGGKIRRAPWAEVAFGYSFEKLVLYAQSLGIGTVWLGGTMNRGAFERAMELSEDEMMPCASPLGYPARSMSLRESVMRGAIRADHRLPFEELFFDGTPSVPLTKERAGDMAELLEAVRLAPSAVNKQPWRILVCDHTVHVYLKRSHGFSHRSLDIQQVDIGIALCHLALAAEERELSLSFSTDAPRLAEPFDAEYIASYTINS